MKEIYEKIKDANRSKIALGTLLISFGLITQLIPFIPGTWAIFLGLEIIGIRLLVQGKINQRLKKSRFINGVFKIKE